MMFLYISLSILCCSPTDNPTAPTTAESNIANHISEARSLYDILEFVAVFPLEQPSPLFEKPRVLVAEDSGFFVANDQGDEIYKYFPDGSFDRTVATKGMGPGEIQFVAFGTRIYDNGIAFWDVHRNTILVFHSDGRFKQEFDVNALLYPHSATPTGATFAWPEPDTLILGSTRLLDKPEAKTVLMTLERDSKGRVTASTITAVLSTRDIEHEKKFGLPISTVMKPVGARYWLGSDAFSSVAIIDPSARQKPGTFQQIHFPEALTARDYEGLGFRNRREINKLINMKGIIFSIMPLDDLVLVQVGAFGFVPFDTAGRQLAKRRIKSRVIGLKDTYRGTAVFVTSRKNIANLERLFKISLFEDSSYDLGDEDQPYAILMRLRDQFQAH